MGNAFRAALLLSLVLPCGVAAVERVPSQRELNGFVIGQYRDAITSYFGEPFMEETTSDGWLHLAIWSPMTRFRTGASSSRPISPIA